MNKPWLAFPGWDFYIGRKSKQDETKTRHYDSHFNYHGYKNPLTGRTGKFELERFIVIQMK